MKCGRCGENNPADAAFCGACGERLKPAANPNDLAFIRTVDSTTGPLRPETSGRRLNPGDRFAGRYDISSVLGEGGMGVVYGATDTLSGRDVALKLIHPERVSGEAAVRRLIAEGATARDIRHPNVVAVYDIDQVDGQPYLSMELIRGQSLRAFINQKRAAREEIPAAAVTAIMVSALAGLEAAHKLGVIHRDLKPENIMLTADPEPSEAPLKLLDFGIARVAGTRETGTMALGTQSYVAPEQITAPETVSPASDLYSLARIHYELLAGSLPMGHWQPPSDGRSDVPAALDKLIERALSNNDRARPQSAAEYRSALLAAMQGASPPPPPPEPEPRKPDPVTPDPIKPKAKMPAWVKIAAAIAGVAVIGAGIMDISKGLGEGGSGGQQERQVDEDEEAFDPQPPPPPPPVSPYRFMNGYWLDGQLGVWQMQVADNGQFRGVGSSGVVNGQAVEGYFNGRLAYYQFGMAGVVTGNGQAEWDGQCHLAFRNYDLYGNQIGSGTIHINHAAGAPCP